MGPYCFFRRYTTHIFRPHSYRLIDQWMVMDSFEVIIVTSVVCPGIVSFAVSSHCRIFYSVPWHVFLHVLWRFVAYVWLMSIKSFSIVCCCCVYICMCFLKLQSLCPCFQETSAAKISFEFGQRLATETIYWTVPHYTESFWPRWSGVKFVQLLLCHSGNLVQVVLCKRVTHSQRWGCPLMTRISLDWKMWQALI